MTKVLHITYSSLLRGPHSGASKGALDLVLAQRQEGIDAHLLVPSYGIFKRTPDFIHTLWNKPHLLALVYFCVFLNLAANHIISSKSLKKDPFTFLPGLVPVSSVTSTGDFDIIHLHWIQWFLSLKSLERTPNKLCFTLRDSRLLTAACHMPVLHNCRQFLTGCESCPLLPNKHILGKILQLSFASQIQIFKRIRHRTDLVGVSRWMTSEASKSPIFNGYNIKTIYNGLDANSFHFDYSARVSFRAKLSIDDSEFVLAAGASNLRNPSKGIPMLLDSLALLKKPCTLILFGSGEFDSTLQCNSKVIYLGSIQDSITLSTIYSAADLFVSPSLTESFGKVIVEANLCKLPALVYASTGQQEIIKEGVNGFYFTKYNAKNLATQLEAIRLLPTSDYQLLRASSRSYAKQFFSSAVCALAYKNLYHLNSAV